MEKFIKKLKRALPYIIAIVLFIIIVPMLGNLFLGGSAVLFLFQVVLAVILGVVVGYLWNRLYGSR